ncbi:MAG: hypothetical protein Kow0062_11500 [Acidobacteriota bacterium]
MPSGTLVRRHVGRSRLRRAAVVAIVLCALALLAWQLRSADPAAIRRLIVSASPAWLAAALALTLARFGVSAWRLGSLTRRLIPCRRRAFVPITMTAQLVGLAIPGVRAGAAVVRAALANRRFGGGVALHLAPNLLDQLLVAVSWMLVALALAPAGAAGRGSGSIRLPVLATVALVLLVTAVAALARWAPRIEAWLGTRPPRRWTGAGRDALGGAGQLAADRVALAIGLAGGLAFAVSTGLAQHAALLAVGAEVPWWIALLAVAVGGTAGTLTGAPGGVGVTEAAQIAVLAAHGVSDEQAAAAVLLARGLHYAVILVGGSVAAAWEWGRGELEGVLDEAREAPS